MFDIGFAELVLIFVVGLLVLGPERLPSAIRNVSLWIGRLRRAFTSLKTEIEREVGAEEIKRQLHNETILANLKETQNTIKDGLHSAEKEFRETGKHLQSLEYDISDVVKDAPAKPAESTAARPADNADTQASNTSQPQPDSKSS